MRRIDRSKPEGFVAYEDAKERLVVAVELAVDGVEGRDARLSAGLRAALDFLAVNPALARLLLIEPLVAAPPVRLAHERSLSQLAGLLSPPPPAGPDGDAAAAEETTRLLAGGLASYLSGRVLAGEAEALAESYELLRDYTLAGLRTAAAVERRVALA